MTTTIIHDGQKFVHVPTLLNQLRIDLQKTGHAVFTPDEITALLASTILRAEESGETKTGDRETSGPDANPMERRPLPPADLVNPKLTNAQAARLAIRERLPNSGRPLVHFGGFFLTEEAFEYALRLQGYPKIAEPGCSTMTGDDKGANDASSPNQNQPPSQT